MNMLRKLFTLLFISLVIVSCKDDEEPGLVDSAAGAYDFETAFYYYIEDGDALEELPDGDFLASTGTVILAKTSETSFDIKQGGEVAFSGESVTPATGGFSFELEGYSMDFFGEDVQVTGYQGASLGGEDFEGTYEKSSKELVVFMEFDWIFKDQNNNDLPGHIVIEFKGTRVLP